MTGADYRKLLDENHELRCHNQEITTDLESAVADLLMTCDAANGLRCGVDELEAKNAELRQRIAELEKPKRRPIRFRGDRTTMTWKLCSPSCADHGSSWRREAGLAPNRIAKTTKTTSTTTADLGLTTTNHDFR